VTIREILYLNPAPYKGFIVDVIKYPKFHALRMYSDNFEEFSDTQKVSLLEWINKVLELINVVTPCRLEREASSDLHKL
jgi:hypothetical protein